jgi:predicted Fe-S protein YdhL (DUF1289 family)
VNRPTGPAATPVASPCISVCRMDEATGWCEGCLRTLDEIALWSVLDADDQRQVLAELVLRRRQWQGLRGQAGGKAVDAPGRSQDGPA